MGDTGLLTFDGVTKQFGDVRAVDNVTLSIAEGETFSLLGPSGCGKTTLLRMAAGFERPDSGRILLNGEDITDLPPEKRPVNTVFQNYALFPHMSVRDNIAFGPKTAKKSPTEIRKAVDEALELVALGDQADKKPGQLSGGQRQRVAIARALVNRPKVLLLDEPLAALDLKLRQRLLVELDTIHDEVGITFLYVTHDQDEAISISDRIAVMNQGKIEQLDSPSRIYEAPKSSFVAAFIGDTNFIEGKVTCTETEHSRVDVPEFGNISVYNDRPVSPGDPIYLSLRPEKIDVSKVEPAPDSTRNVLRGNVEDVIYFGPTTRYWIRVGGYKISAQVQHRRFLLDEEPPTWGDEVWISWHSNDGYLLDTYRPEDEALLALPDELESDEEN